MIFFFFPFKLVNIPLLLFFSCGRVSYHLRFQTHVYNPGIEVFHTTGSSHADYYKDLLLNYRLNNLQCCWFVGSFGVLKAQSPKCQADFQENFYLPKVAASTPGTRFIQVSQVNSLSPSRVYKNSQIKTVDFPYWKKKKKIKCLAHRSQ